MTLTITFKFYLETQINNKITTKIISSFESEINDKSVIEIQLINIKM